jgi:Bacterial membrane protein YfhO
VIRPKNEKHFWILGLVVFAFVTLWTYFPVLSGKVPFPREIALQFQAWNTAGTDWHYADIGDLVTAFYPFRAVTSRAVHDGSLPLWNPYFLGGAPFLANAQSSLFYPPNFLYFLLSVPTAWTICLMLRVFLAGLFMMIFVRSIGGSKAGAIVSGLVFSMCGFMTAWQGQPMTDSAIWLPLACYSIVRLRNTPSGLSIAIAAFAFAMPVLAGHPETAAHVILVATAFALLTFVRPSLDFRFLLRFTFCGLLALGIAAIQLLPTLEWISQLPNAFDKHWPPLPLHEALGWVSRDMLRAPNSAGLWIPESAAYVGMGTLLLSSVGLLHRSRRHVIFLAILIIVGGSMAYGVQPIQWLASHTPILNGLKNSRMIFVASFGIAALAGLGLTVLEDSPLPWRRRVMALTLIAVAFILAFVFYYSLRNATQLRVEFSRRPSFSRAMLFAGLIPLMWRLASARVSRAFSAVMCAVVAFDLLTFGYGVTGFSGREDIFPPAPVFQFLADHNEQGQSRIALLGSPYPINANLMYGIPSADGYEVGLVLPQSLFSLDYMGRDAIGIGFDARHLLDLKDRRLDLLNVKYVTTTSVGEEFNLLKDSKRFRSVYNDGHLVIFENTSVLPRAFLVPKTGIELLKDTDSQLATFRDPAFDPQKTVIVSNRPASLSSLSSASAPGQAANNFVKITGTGVNDVSIRAAASETSVLVVSQTYYPGWKAIVDGKTTEVFPVNMTLTGVAVEPGTHDIRLVFDPMSFKVGAGLTLLSLIIGVALVAVRKSTHDESLIRPDPVVTA